jgi:hypothetical protein
VLTQRRCVFFLSKCRVFLPKSTYGNLRVRVYIIRLGEHVVDAHSIVKLLAQRSRITPESGFRGYVGSLQGYDDYTRPARQLRNRTLDKPAAQLVRPKQSKRKQRGQENRINGANCAQSPEGVSPATPCLQDSLEHRLIPAKGVHGIQGVALQNLAQKVGF